MYIRRDNPTCTSGASGGGAAAACCSDLDRHACMLAVGVLMRFNTVAALGPGGGGHHAPPTLDAITRAQLGERAYLPETSKPRLPTNARRRISRRQHQHPVRVRARAGLPLLRGRSFFYHAEEALDVAQRAVEVAPDNAQANALLCLALVTNAAPKKRSAPD